MNTENHQPVTMRFTQEVTTDGSDFYVEIRGASKDPFVAGVRANNEPLTPRLAAEALRRLADEIDQGFGLAPATT